MKKYIFLPVFLLLFSFTGYSQTPQKDSVDNDDPLSVVEKEAEFPGGSRAWIDYLQKNLRLSQRNTNRTKPGNYTVVVRFIVDKDGSIYNIMAETNIGHGMEKEALRVISNSPKWIPAFVNGKPVKAYRRQPIVFSVSNE